MALDKRIRSRLVDALSGTPTVVSMLLVNTPGHSSFWDYRASPERFSLREIIAHLADYDTMWLEYLTAALSSSDDHSGPPEVTAYAPDERAAKYDYEDGVPSESLAAFTASRQKLVSLMPTLESDEWETHAVHSQRHGLRTVEGLATQILAHDGYHTRQIAEYLTSATHLR